MSTKTAASSFWTFANPHNFMRLSGALLVACSEGMPDALPPPSRDGWSTDAAWPGFTLIVP